jgi:phytoene/squalene synthetase
MNLLLRASQRPARGLYDHVAEGSAAEVIRQYSSSFGLASLLLAEPVRTQIRNIYALVRIADEIVDNPEPSLGREPRERMLAWLQEDARHAVRIGYSANLIVHAFARTAVDCGIDESLSTRSSTRCGWTSSAPSTPTRASTATSMGPRR